jgi:PAS domain-containing protein
MPQFPKRASKQELFLHQPSPSGGNKLLEKRLSLSKSRHSQTFETIQDGVLILKFDTGEIIDVNPTLIAMLGYSRKKFIGKRLYSMK